MEQKKFIQILRKVIKEEVRSVIKQELTEILQEGLKPTINNISSEQKKQSITETFNNRPKKRKVQFKENKFSDILNDTDGLTEPNSKSNYAQLMTEDIVMTSADANAFGVQRKMQSSNSTPTVVDAETGQHINVDPVTAKAMTRDYSSLMKAIDKRKGFS